MAVKWDGFTDEDIRKFKSRGNDSADTTRKESSPLVIQKRATLSVAARRSCDKLQSASSASSAHHHIETSIPDKARLSNSTSHSRSKFASVPKMEPCAQSETNGCSTVAATAAAVAATTVPDGVEAAVNANGEASALNSFSPAPPFTLSRPRSLVSALMGPSLTAPPLPAIDINDFEARQKVIEEQNRLKKVFLSKALEDRKKQASAEAKRLSMIQEELQKLDQRLSGDVSIIRNQIESASIEFLEAQKRYDRAEKEFLEAKMLFFTKLERKELLTHHLCTIIEQNEMRKAQKLSELMEKLDLRAEQLQENALPDCENKNIRKLSAEVILTPAEAGGAAVGAGIVIGTENGNGNSPPDSAASFSKETDSQVSLETSK